MHHLDGAPGALAALVAKIAAGAVDGLLLIFAGMAYTVAVEHWLKGQAERENENVI